MKPSIEEITSRSQTKYVIRRHHRAPIATSPQDYVSRSFENIWIINNSNNNSNDDDDSKNNNNDDYFLFKND